MSDTDTDPKIVRLPGNPVQWNSMPPQLQNFEKAFSSSSGHCRMECECGRVYYNPDGGWTWEEGELDKLDADSNATAVEYTVGEVVFEGKQYANPCDCWHARAFKLIAWIVGHDDAIALFLTLEKKRKQEEADASPVVEDLHQR